MKATTIMFIICISSFKILIAQSSVKYDHKQFGPQPTVGTRIPDFRLTDITHYPKKQASSKDFLGKWLILDFWFPECTSCIKSFPKMDALQRELGDKLQIVLVGQNGQYQYTARGIAKMYERMQAKQQYILASAYDSILTYQWGINAMPHLIIIDPKGVVIARTTSADINKENLTKLFAGEKVSFQKADIEQDTFEGGIYKDMAREDSNLIFRSIFLRKPKDQEVGGITSINYQFKDTTNFQPGQRGYKAEGFTLLKLYNVAYFGQAFWLRRTDSLYGKVYPFPVLNIKDSTPFKPEPNNGEYFNYCLTVPSRLQTPEKLMQIMQVDLKNSLGYNVRFEKLKMTAWILTADTSAVGKLATKGGPRYFSNSEEGNSIMYGFEWRNAQFNQLVGVLSAFLPAVKYMTPLPLFDETGINEPIDIIIHAPLSRPEQVAEELKKFGLHLAKGEKEFTVMVISD